MLPTGTVVTLVASGYAGGWSPFANATPAELQDAITLNLTAQGLTVLSDPVTAGVTTAILSHEFPYTAALVVKTQSPLSLEDVTSLVQTAVSDAAGQSASVANQTAGDPAPPAPANVVSGLFAGLTAGLGLLIVGGVVLVIVLHEVHTR